MKKKIYREKSYEWKWQIFEKRKKKKKRKNKNRDEIFWTRRKNRDELAETQEGGKDGRWRVIREWRVRGWADRGGITFLLLSIDRSSYRSASSSSSSLLDFFLPPASSSLACFQLFLPSNGGTHSIRRCFSPTISRRIDCSSSSAGDRSKGEDGPTYWEEMKGFCSSSTVSWGEK